MSQLSPSLLAAAESKRTRNSLFTYPPKELYSSKKLTQDNKQATEGKFDFNIPQLLCSFFFLVSSLTDNSDSVRFDIQVVEPGT